MIFLIIGFFIIGIGIKNFKKGFLYYLIYKAVLVTNITLLSVPGIPMLSLSTFMTLMFIALFFREKRHCISDNAPFPFTIPFKLVTVSYGISTVFAIVGFSSALSAYVKEITEDFLLVFLIWRCLDTRDFIFVFKGLTIVFLLSCIYGFYEHEIQSNPLMAYEESLVVDKSRVISFEYGIESHRGYRVQSIFEHAIGAGINWAMYFIVVMIMLTFFNVKLKSHWIFLMVLTSFMCIPCIFFSNSRASIVFLMIGAMCFINFRNRKFLYFILAAFVLFFVVAPYVSDYMINVVSIFDSEAADQVGGSNYDMRFNQLMASFALMLQSPLIGLGYKFTSVLNNNSLVYELLGMESMWFRILTQFGILGVIANLFFAYYSLIKIPKKNGSKTLFFWGLSYWCVASMTSVPGMLMYLYFLVYIYILKSANKCHLLSS